MVTLLNFPMSSDNWSADSVGRSKWEIPLSADNDISVLSFLICVSLISSSSVLFARTSRAITNSVLLLGIIWT